MNNLRDILYSLGQKYWHLINYCII